MLDLEEVNPTTVPPIVISQNSRKNQPQQHQAQRSGGGLIVVNTHLSFPHNRYDRTYQHRQVGGG